jgi:NAD(P)-dependent dehydrogenase (short-subunit alcohol dehydrogenase family)
MIGQKSGAIINISSTASVQNQPASIFSYYASKSGVNHLTRALAVHYAAVRNSRQCGVAGRHGRPADLSADSRPVPRYRGDDPLVQRRRPDGSHGHGVAHAALFLASEEAKYITGVCLPVDGGKSCT